MIFEANILSDAAGYITSYLTSMSWQERTSIIIIISSALLMIALERAFPYNKGQKVFREGFFDDFVMYTIAQNYVLSILIFSYIIYYIDNATGLSRLELLKDVPVWIQLVFFTITHDLYIYWMHRWQHSNKYLWRIHEAHHTPVKVDWLSGSRSHAVEILINQTIEFAPIILLGSPPEVIAWKGVISAVWGMWIHSNININTGRLQLLINGPEMHRWHHSKSKGRNRNFATKLAIWDWMFGTGFLPEDKKADRYGLGANIPEHYFSQFVWAFRSFGRRKNKGK